MEPTSGQAGTRVFIGCFLCAVGAVLAVVVVVFLAFRPADKLPPNKENVAVNSETRTVKSLIQERERLDATVWEEEVLAQRYEEFFVTLWDKLRPAKDKLAVLADVPFESITLGDPQEPGMRDGEIRNTDYGGPGRSLSSEDWRRLIEDAKQNHLQIVQTEWHHAQFEAPVNGVAKSTINVLIHAINTESQKRYELKGALDVEWFKAGGDETLPKPRLIDARNISVIERPDTDAFDAAWTLDEKELRPSELIPPVLVYDLDRDGLSDLVLPSYNLLCRNLGNWQFEKKDLLKNPPQATVESAVLGDFTGDGNVDLLCAAQGSPLAMYAGDSQGRFSTSAKIVDCVDDKVYAPSVLTAGDIDLDGDLDVWFAQYKGPYVLGQMPTPYFDANDGFASFLLLNDGDGRFQDATVAGGLEAKRMRRTYSGSLVDLDEDGDLDLVTANDFAGLDMYLNDGHGIFQDVSQTHVDHRHAFGMGLTFADYNRDGKLDFYMIGMSSTTARRLEQLGLGREDFAQHQEKRSAMGYGNRMYLAADKGFQQAPFNDQVARSGWSWGATSLDFDNDADSDVYVANGHRSGKTAKDYCTKYWRHDIYTGTSNFDQELSSFFSDIVLPEQKQMSWNGFEHNCLFMNESGRGFLRVDFLMGVSIEADSRNVVSDDFDGDGRKDLLVLHMPRDRRGFKIQLLRNNWQSDHHWVGIHLQDAPRRSPLGARVSVEYAGGRQTTSIVAGDSFYSQHAATAHFGLGEVDKIDAIEITWPGGKKLRLPSPEIDRYHTIKP